jgi:type I restriction enzyme S subunit
MVPLRAIYRRVEARDRADLQLLSVYRDLGVVPRAGRDDNFNKASDDLSAYKVVLPGDLVLNKMKTWQGSLGVSAFEGIVSPAYFVGRRIAEVDDRFMHHLLRSAPLIAEYGARSKGIRPSQWDLPWEEFASIKVRLPEVGVQRAVAAFLDSFTERMDRLVAMKERLLSLLSERESALAAQLLDGAEPMSRSIQLGQVLDRLIDYRGATPEKADDGVPLLTASNVIGGQIDFSTSRQFIPASLYVDWMRRGLPQVGDVLFTSEAPLGEVALIEDDGVALAQRLILLRPRKDIALPEFLLVFLRSPIGRAEVQSRASGSTVMGVRTDRLRQVRVQVPPLEVQREIVERMSRAVTRSRALTELLDTQLFKIKEYRKATITAAVTGELEITGVAA